MLEEWVAAGRPDDCFRLAARDSVARCPRLWACAEDRSEPICRWVSEDRRSRAARWGAWAPKIRRQFGINHLVAATAAVEAVCRPHCVAAARRTTTCAAL